LKHAISWLARCGDVVGISEMSDELGETEGAPGTTTAYTVIPGLIDKGFPEDAV
jgi:hypothetical protein